MSYHYIVELRPGVFVAAWNGRVSSCMSKENAKTFSAYGPARDARIKAQKSGFNPNAKIIKED